MIGICRSFTIISTTIIKITLSNWEKLLDRIEKEKDSDIKPELKKGNIVEAIENGSDY